MNFSNKYCMCVHFWPFLFWEDFETTQTRWAVKFQNFFGGATWSKFAPGTCESCPSWCWKGNWRGAANFLRPDVQMDGLFLRFEEGKKKGLEEKHSLIFCPEVFFVAWLIDKKSTRITGNISPRWRTDLPAGMRHQEHKEAQKHYFNLKLQNIACNLYKGNQTQSQFWRSCLPVFGEKKHVAGDFGRFQNSHWVHVLWGNHPRQVMAPYSADYPKVIIHPTDTCKFRLELCDEQDGYGYAVFFFNLKNNTNDPEKKT